MRKAILVLGLAVLNSACELKSPEVCAARVDNISYPKSASGDAKRIDKIRAALSYEGCIINQSSMMMLSGVRQQDIADSAIYNCTELGDIFRGFFPKNSIADVNLSDGWFLYQNSWVTVQGFVEVFEPQAKVCSSFGVDRSPKQYRELLDRAKELRTEFDKPAYREIGKAEIARMNAEDISNSVPKK